MSDDTLDRDLEKKLIESARENKKNFEPLYKNYKDKIQKFFFYKTSDNFVSEDLTSKVFEKALNGLDNFQWQGVSFSAWLYKIARNTLIDYYRLSQHKKEEQLDEKDFQTLDFSPANLYETEISEQLIYKILQELPPRERYIIYMKFFEGYTNRVISKITGLSETNVGTIIYRTIRKIRQDYFEI